MEQKYFSAEKGTVEKKEMEMATNHELLYYSGLFSRVSYELCGVLFILRCFAELKGNQIFKKFRDESCL